VVLYRVVDRIAKREDGHGPPALMFARLPSGLRRALFALALAASVSCSRSRCCG